jgi:hypothetical protein
LRLQSLPRCRAAPGARARGAAVLRWCSPQSSVPRQTVGSHARAAMYEMGPTAACEGRRGEVPRQCLDIPPAGASASPFSYTHRPGRSGRHGPAGWGVGFPIPQNSFGCVLQKRGSRACGRAISCHGPRGECRMPEGGLPCTVCPGPPTQGRLPWTAHPEPPSQAVYPGPPTQGRLPWTAHPGPPTLDRPPRPSTLDRPPKPVYPGPPAQNRPPNPSTLDRPPRAGPQPVYPGPPTRTGLPALPEISASIFDFERRTVMDFLAKTLAPSTLSL